MYILIRLSSFFVGFHVYNNLSTRKCMHGPPNHRERKSVCFVKQKMCDLEVYKCFTMGLGNLYFHILFDWVKVNVV